MDMGHLLCLAVHRPPQPPAFQGPNAPSERPVVDGVRPAHGFEGAGWRSSRRVEMTPRGATTPSGGGRARAFRPRLERGRTKGVGFAREGAEAASAKERVRRHEWLLGGPEAGVRQWPACDAVERA